MSARLTDAVHCELRRCLFSGRLRAGEVLRLRALAAHLGTSVQPVRDAVQRLVAEGALEQGLNRDIRVCRLSRDSLVELYRVRILLEGEATAMAAGHGTVDLGAAEAAIDRMIDASDRSDSGAYSAANFDFHFGIYRAAGSFHLMPLIETLWLRIGPMLDIGPGGTTRAEIRMFEGQQDHRDILAAIARKDAETARARLADDLERARDWFLRHHPFVPSEVAAGVRPLPARRGKDHEAPAGATASWSMQE